ncbi:hypothetical protein DFS34DRAFT_575660 [Phlyctochytrium arcticum]|nr:hypothetical protein DFS34DRAFT_575660 [Phlyctochytrium arcticum]
MAKEKRNGPGEVGNKFGRPDLDRMGLFSEAPYISVGDKFAERNEHFLGYRTKGKQFITNPPKRGHETRDAFFDKEFIRLFENEPYTDLVKLRRKWRLASKDKNIVTAPFRPSNVPPAPCGSGSPWGTFEQQWPLERKGGDEIPSFALLRETPATEPKINFLTRPPKKGTGYGYANVTIGKSYEFKDDPYDSSLVAARAERSVHKRKVIGERPFISSSSKSEFFSPFASLMEAQPGQAAKGTREKTPPTSKLPALTPFKPSSGVGYTINKYPSHESPVVSKGGKKSKGEPEAEDKGSKQKIPKTSLIFRPGGVPKSYPVRSIVDCNIPIAPPMWIQEAREGVRVT